MKNVCMTVSDLLLKESIDIIDMIKMLDDPSKVKLASEKLRSAVLTILNAATLEVSRVDPYLIIDWSPLI